jgi:hypothetical protein
VLVACSGPGGATATPSSSEDAEEADGQIAAARTALGEPMVALADALLASSTTLDEARHALPRGEAVRAAARDLTVGLDALREVALAADRAGRELEGEGRIARAADVVTDAAEVAVRAADEAVAHAAALERLATFDVRMDAAVAEWNAPGSQGDRRAVLGEQANAMDALRAEAAAEPPVPEPCPAQRDSRVRWAGVVAERSRSLAALATGQSGEDYDALRRSFGDAPFEEDRQALDAADRGCWAEHSTLTAAAAGIRNQVETLESLLQD